MDIIQRSSSWICSFIIRYVIVVDVSSVYMNDTLPSEWCPTCVFVYFETASGAYYLCMHTQSVGSLYLGLPKRVCCYFQCCYYKESVINGKFMKLVTVPRVGHIKQVNFKSPGHVDETWVIYLHSGFLSVKGRISYEVAKSAGFLLEKTLLVTTNYIQKVDVLCGFQCTSWFVSLPPWKHVKLKQYKLCHRTTIYCIHLSLWQQSHTNHAVKLHCGLLNFRPHVIPFSRLKFDSSGMTR
jgi:hypothetical protein